MMKLGVFTGFAAGMPSELISATGELAEEYGFHSLWVPEHVLLFREYDSPYPYTTDGKMPFATGGLVEPFSALTWIAARTGRIRLGTGICIVPQRNPVYTAKQVADLDYLSGGRVDFGVGVGWLREEFEALGAPWAERGARTNDYLALMKALWTGELPYPGRFHSVPECIFGPAPAQQPHPPVYVGGNSAPALRRVAQLGQGWYGHDLSPEHLPAHLEQLDKELARCGRGRADVKVVVSPFFRPVDRDTVRRFRDQGIDQLLLPFLAGDVDGLRRRAEDLRELVS